MTPLQLDYIINGAKVYIYRRPDGSTYASVQDLSRFVQPVKTVRVKLTESSTVDAVLNDAKVKRALAVTSQTLNTEAT